MMDSIDSNELWRQIPPEEKIELLSKAHSRGILAAFSIVVVAGTVAVGLHLPEVLWSSLLLAPLVFQFTAGKAWRGLRPRVMLEYLAARSVARRYAFAHRSHDLTLMYIFRGHFQEQFGKDQIHEALEASVRNSLEAEVWIGLFRDTVIMLSERPGGARLEFGGTLDDKLTVSGSDSDGKGDYNANKEVLITQKDPRGVERQIKVTSRYPAALIVFEKKLLQCQAEYQEQLKAMPLEMPDTMLDDDMGSMPMDDLFS